MLELSDIRIEYGAVAAVRGVSMHVSAGETVAVIGPNGAGKTSILRSVSGLVRVRRGQMRFEGQDLVGRRPHEIVKLGVTHVPEGRRVFVDMTVEENLRVGAYLTRAAAVQARMEAVFEMFPRIRERRRQLAGTMSGGEQQMLSIGRALMAEPKLLLLDEPSLGVAPLVVQELRRILREISQRGVTVVLVEQNAALAFDVSTRVYVIENGEITLEGATEDVAGSPHVRAAYLGDSG